ncbi:MAG: formylglycine-generating enzyme family protein, partial [Planctomycetales bacterium]|nr:formylglycine-generating enzyme family protein [Planctomycetales bacterium]
AEAGRRAAELRREFERGAEEERARCERAAKAAQGPRGAVAAWEAFPVSRFPGTEAARKAQTALREARAAEAWTEARAQVEDLEKRRAFTDAKARAAGIAGTWAGTAAAREAQEAAERLGAAEDSFRADAERALAAADRFAKEKPESYGEIQARYEAVAESFPQTREAETALKRAANAQAASQAAKGPQLAFSDAQDHAATHPEDFAGIRLRYETVVNRFPKTDWASNAKLRLADLERRREREAENEAARTATLLKELKLDEPEKSRRPLEAAKRWEAFPARFAGTTAAGRATAEAEALRGKAAAFEVEAKAALQEATLARSGIRDPWPRDVFVRIRERYGEVHARWPETAAGTSAAETLGGLERDRAAAAAASLREARTDASKLAGKKQFDEAERVLREKVLEPFGDLPVAEEAERELRGHRETRFFEESQGKWREKLGGIRTLAARNPDAHDQILGELDLFSKRCPDEALRREATALAAEVRERRQRTASDAAEAALALAEGRASEGDWLGALAQLAKFPAAFADTDAHERVDREIEAVTGRLREEIALLLEIARDRPGFVGAARARSLDLEGRYRGTPFEREAREARDEVARAADARASGLVSEAEALEGHGDWAGAAGRWALAAECGSDEVKERASSRRAVGRAKAALAVIRGRLRSGDVSGAREAAEAVGKDATLAFVHEEARALREHAETILSGTAYVPGAKLPRPGGADVEVPAFYMDLRETTNEEFAEFVRAGGYADERLWDPEAPRYDRETGLRGEVRGELRREYRDRTGRPGPRGWSDGATPAGQGLHPVRGVTWYEARAYARFRGKDLPTEEQWEVAAGLDPATGALRAYPWGDVFERSRAYAGVDEGGPASAEVGTYPSGASPWGCLDMAGNVREWTLSWVDGATRRERATKGGGAFLLDAAEETRVASRHGKPPELDGDDIGFRCVRPAPPPELILGASGR